MTCPECHRIIDQFEGCFGCDPHCSRYHLGCTCGPCMAWYYRRHTNRCGG